MSAGVRAGLVAVLSGALTSALLVMPASPAGATSGGVTVTASASTVAPGSTVDLTAGIPVSAAGTLNQEIVQTIDPTKVVLTAESDITYPAGWTLSYCSGAATDCTNAANFSATTPGNAAAWAAVKAVKATGSIDSEGASSNGKQVASRTSAGAFASTGGSITGTRAGDGWDVFFDPAYTRIFNRFHHQANAPKGLEIDCRWLFADASRPVGQQAAGDRCGGGTNPWIRGTDSLNFTSDNRSTGWIDSQNRLWAPTEKKTDPGKGFGFACWDVSGATPVACASGLWTQLQSGSSTSYDGVMDLARIGSRLYTQTYTGHVLCLDTQATGGPAPCPGQPYLLGAAADFGGLALTGSAEFADIKAIQGKLYYFRSSDRLATDGRVSCIDPTLLAAGATAASVRCAGWPSTPPLVGGGPLIAAPNSSGTPVAVCGVKSSVCVNLANGTTTVPGLPSNLQSTLRTFSSGAVNTGRKVTGVATIGSRIYWPHVDLSVSPNRHNVYCFDSATNAVCANWPQIEQSVYTITPDPRNPRCVWTNSDLSQLVVRDGVTGATGCMSGISIVSFPASASVPRMACTANSGIQEWVDFRIAGVGSPDRRWTAARLTVRTPSGAAVPGWDDTLIPDTGVMLLGALPVSGGSGDTAWVAGQLEFRVAFDGATYSASTMPTATIRIIGDAPQLCMRLTAQAICPVALGPVKPGALLPGTVTVTGSGSSTISGVNSSFTPDTKNVAVSAPTSAQCGSTLTGRTGDDSLGAAGVAVPGVLVALLDDTGNALRDDSGNAITATTDPTGAYSFGFLTPGSYKVSFPSTGTATSTSATVVGGSTVSAVSGTSTSAAAVLAVGTNRVVNGQYAVQPVARPNTQTGAQGAVQTFNPLLDDSASTGASYSGGSTAVRLCSTGQAYPSCTATSMVVAGQGSYAVSGTTVSFTPCTGVGTPVMSPSCTGSFTGTATAVTYQSTDSLGRTGSSTITPTVAGVPTLVPNTSTSSLNSVQTISPLADDSAGTGTSLDVSTLRICTSATADSSCTLSSLTVAGQGVYTVNAGGTVSFSPCQATGSSGAGCTGPFVGAASAIRYTVSDGLSQKAFSTITATVTAPSNTATDDTSAGGVGVTQSVNPLANDTSPSGITLQPATVKLCSASQSPPACTGTYRIVDQQGVYTVDAVTGALSFTPCNATPGNLRVNGTAYATNCSGTPFTGTPTAARYQVSDNVAATPRVVSALYTPFVVAKPTATADTSTGAMSTAQVINVRANDSAASGQTLVTSSIELCTASTDDSTCDSNNSKSLTRAGQGVYVVDDTTGIVTFTPCGSASGSLVVGGVSYATSCTGVPFTGTATAIKYIVRDTIGQIASSTITPTVTTPPPVNPAADTSTGGQGVAQTINPLANDDTVSAGVTKNATTVRFCGSGQSLPNCLTNSVVVAGQGVYTVNTTTGIVTFTPCNGVIGNLTVGGVAYGTSCTTTPFTGTPPPVTYQASDNLNRVFSSTYTPTVYGRPNAVANTSTGPFNTAQSISPLADDTAAAGASLVTSSLRLCGPGDDTRVTGGCDDTTLIVAGQGTYAVNPSTGVVTFTPLSTFTGTATPVRYQVADNVGQSATATITPTVTAPAASSAVADTTTGGQGVAQVLNLLANDSTPAGVSLTASSTRLCNPGTSPAQTAPNCTATSVTVMGVGTYTLSGGTVTFTPLPGYAGTPTALGYQVTDSLGRNVSSTYTPTVVPRPNAVDDTSTGAYTLPQTIDVLGDDTAGAATSLVASSVRLCGPGDDSATTSTGSASRCDDTTLMTASGTFTVNASGSVTFSPCTANGVPNPSCTGAFSGTAPAVAYQVADALGQLDAAAIVVSVAPPVAPSAADDTVTVRPGASAAFASITATGGLATPGDGSLVPASTCLVDPSSGATPPACDSDDTVTIAGVGTWQLNRTTGVVTFTADPSATSGAKTAVSYRVTDTNGQTATGRLVPVIPPLPVAVDDSTYGEQGQAQVILPAGNDVPGDPAAPMSAASVRLCDPSVPQSVPNCTATSVSVTGQGTYSVNPANGQVTFTPIDDTFYGVVTPVGYQIADATGQIAGAQIRPEVLPRPAPRAVDDSGSAAYGQTVTLTPLANDDSGTLPTDGSVTGLSLNAASLKLCASGQSPPTCSATSVTTVDGTYTLSGASVTFSPVSGFSGMATAPLQYQVSNAYTQSVGGTPTAKAQTSSAYLIPTIAAPTPPAAVDDTKVGVVNTTVALAPIANDTSGQVAPLLPASLRLCDTPSQSPSPLPGTCTATSVSVPGKGTLTLNPSTGQVEFAPLTDWTGTLTRPYVIADGAGNVVTANVSITINAPTAVNDDTYGLPGAVQTLSVLSNDSAAAGTATTLNASSVRLCASGEMVPSCTATSVTTANGTYTVSGGVVTFTPVAGFTNGDDSVAYVVRDSVGQVASAIARPYVVGPPNPSAADDSGYAPLGEPVTFRPWVNDDTMGNKTVGSITYTDTGFTRSSVRLCGPGDAAGSCDDTTLTTADGSYAVNPATGVVTFTPVSGFTGTAAYPVTYEITNPYTVNAGSGSGSQVVSATLTPTVVAPPSPSATDDTGTAGYGQPVTFSPWSNDTPMGDATTGTVFYDDSGFTPTSVRLCGAGDVVPTCDDTTVSTADGTYVVNPATGVVTFTPAPGFSGSAAAVRYQISNAYSATNSGNPAGSGTQVTSALLQPTIGPLTPPNADADAGSGYVDDTVVVNLPANDDSGTYPLDLTSVKLCDDTDVAPACTHMSAVLAGQGTLVVNPVTGAVTFTPASGWTGSLTVPYTITDTQGSVTVSTLTITITAPVPPTANNDSASTAVDTPVVLPAGADDDTGTYALDLSSVRICASDDTAPACTKLTLTITEGTFTVTQATGMVTFTPATGWYGTVTVPYSVTDIRGNRDDALLSVTIPAPSGGGGGGAPPGGGGGGAPPGGGGGGAPSPSPSPGPDPVTEPDGGVGRPGDPVRVDPIGNDSPGAGQAFDESSLRLCPVGTTPPGCTGLVVQTDQGTWVADPFTGAVTFTPEPGFEGLVEMPYVVKTEAGEVVDSVIWIWITDPPAAADDASAGQVDRPQTLDPWTNDDHDAAPWDRGSLALCGAGQTPPGCDRTRVQTPDGVYEVDPVTGKVIFTPAPGFTGTATPLQYQVADVAGQVASAWLRPTVRGGQGERTGWLQVRKVVTGNDLRTGEVKLVTVCSGDDRQVHRVHRLPVGDARASWRVQVPAGMTCQVRERAHGAPKAPSLAPMWKDKRWPFTATPTLGVGQQATVGAIAEIDSMVLSVDGGCTITAGTLTAVAAGTCTVTWRAAGAQIATITRWTHTTPRGTRTQPGTLTRAITIAAGHTTQVTFHNRYTTRDLVITRTLHVTDTCPTTKTRPTLGGDPSTCVPASKSRPFWLRTLRIPYVV